MKEHPILCTDSVVRAILENRQTQDRRPITRLQGFGPITQFGPSPTRGYDWHFRNKRMLWNDLRHARFMECAPWAKGDVLWCRECWGVPHNKRPRPELDHRDLVYRADGDREFREYGYNWTPSIHMPRWACRLTLEVLDVRVERVRDISEEDAQAEGVGRECGNTIEGCAMDYCRCEVAGCPAPLTYRDGFFDLMSSLYGPDILDKWVWATTFKLAPPQEIP